MKNHSLSQHKACPCGAHRSLIQYQKTHNRDSVLKDRLQELAHQSVRFGYRRLHCLLQREGEAINHEKVYRLYKALGLAVKRRKGRKRAQGSRGRLLLPQQANQRWSVDFVHDT